MIYCLVQNYNKKSNKTFIGLNIYSYLYKNKKGNIIFLILHKFLVFYTSSAINDNKDILFPKIREVVFIFFSEGSFAAKMIKFALQFAAHLNKKRPNY